MTCDGHNTTSMLWGKKTAYYVKLSAEDLSHYLNKIELICLRKSLYYHYLSRKSDVTIKTDTHYL